METQVQTAVEEMKKILGPTLVDMRKIEEAVVPTHLRAIQKALEDNYDSLIKLTQRVENVARKTIGYSCEEKAVDNLVALPNGIIFEIQTLHNTLDSTLSRLASAVEALETL